MPTMRYWGQIKSIKKLNVPCSPELFKKMVEEITAEVDSGILLGLTAKVSLVLPKESTRNAYQIHIDFSEKPTHHTEFEVNIQQHLLAMQAYYEAMAESFCIFFHLNEAGNVDEIATDFDAEFFRKIMQLTPTGSELFSRPLYNTDYWLPNQKFFKNEKQAFIYLLFRDTALALNNRLIVNRDFLNQYIDEYQTIPRLYTFMENLSPDEFFKKIFPQFSLEALSIKKIEEQKKKILAAVKKTARNASIKLISIAHKLSADHPESDIERDAPPGQDHKIKKIANHAYKKALNWKENPFTGTQAEFNDPLSEKSRAYIQNQIVPQLKDTNILNLPSGIVLDVGAGDTRNTQALQKNFPHLHFFAVEPVKQFATDALNKFQYPSDHLFIMPIQKFPEQYNGKFDVILVLNWNILSGHSDVINKIYELLKPGGVVVIGRSATDPEHIASPFTITTLLSHRFGRQNITNPGWLTPRQPNYENKLVLYQATKTIEPSFLPPPSTPSIIETDINDLNRSSWQTRNQKPSEWEQAATSHNLLPNTMLTSVIAKIEETASTSPERTALDLPSGFPLTSFSTMRVAPKDEHPALQEGSANSQGSSSQNEDSKERKSAYKKLL